MQFCEVDNESEHAQTNLVVKSALEIVDLMFDAGKINRLFFRVTFTAKLYTLMK